jgi:hypothetical protein
MHQARGVFFTSRDNAGRKSCPLHDLTRIIRKISEDFFGLITFAADSALDGNNLDSAFPIRVQIL